MTPNPELFRTAMSAPVETPMLPAPGRTAGTQAKIPGEPALPAWKRANLRSRRRNRRGQ